LANYDRQVEAVAGIQRAWGPIVGGKLLAGEFAVGVVVETCVGMCLCVGRVVRRGWRIRVGSGRASG